MSFGNCLWLWISFIPAILYYGLWLSILDFWELKIHPMFFWFYLQIKVQPDSVKGVRDFAKIFFSYKNYVLTLI